MSTGILVVFFGVLLTLGCLGLALRVSVLGPRRHMRRRLETVNQRFTGGAPGGKHGTGAVNSVRRKEQTSGMPVLDRIAKRFLPRQSLLRARLARTGRNIPIGTYVLVNVIVTLAVALVALVIVGLPPFLAALISFTIGIGVPHFVVGRLAGNRVKRFTAVFPDAIDLIVRGLKSGLPVAESINAVGAEMADPVGHEFRLVSDNIKFGMPLEEALWEVSARLDIQEFKFFIISLSVQRETGGNLAETLANLSEILRRRRQMSLKVKAMSSEARASAYILGSLPFIMFGIIFMLNPGYETELFTDPRGRMMLGAGLVTMLMGIAVMAKMVKFEI